MKSCFADSIVKDLRHPMGLFLQLPNVLRVPIQTHQTPVRFSHHQHQVLTVKFRHHHNLLTVLKNQLHMGPYLQFQLIIPVLTVLYLHHKRINPCPKNPLNMALYLQFQLIVQVLTALFLPLHLSKNELFAEAIQIKEIQLQTWE